MKGGEKEKGKREMSFFFTERNLCIKGFSRLWSDKNGERNILKCRKL